MRKPQTSSGPRVASTSPTRPTRGGPVMTPGGAARRWRPPPVGLVGDELAGHVARLGHLGQGLVNPLLRKLARRFCLGTRVEHADGGDGATCILRLEQLV